MKIIVGLMAIAGASTIAGCASSKGTATEGNAPVVTSTVQPHEMAGPGGNYIVNTREDKDVMVTTILAPLDSVWRALPGVFLELGVEPGTIDQQQHVISNTSFKQRRALGGTKLSKYFDCGYSVVGANADQMVITISLTVQAVRDSVEITSLRTQVTAYGRADATSDPAVNCATTGSLEARVAHMVNDDLAHRKSQ